MTGTTYAIGEVARMTGLPVATIRYYSNLGLLPPVARTASGYRRYDRESVARLELIRTLRDLGVDLATVTRVIGGALSIAEIAQVEAEALETRIRALRLRQAVLRHVAAHGADSAGAALAHRVARLSADERRRMVEQLVDEASRGLELDPVFAARLRSTLPELPPDPTVEQIEAWIELAGLVRDPDFRASVRRAFERHAADRASGADGGDAETWRRAERAVVERVGRALDDGVPPASPEARPVVDEMVAVFAAAHRRRDDAAFRAWLAERVEVGGDPRVGRYYALLAAIGGGPAGPDPVPAARWFLTALRNSMAAGRAG